MRHPGPLASAGSVTYVAQLNLQAITAVILGGVALTGGEGGIFGTVVGVLIMNTILQGLTLMNMSEFFQDIMTGMVLLVASPSVSSGLSWRRGASPSGRREHRPSPPSRASGGQPGGLINTKVEGQVVAGFEPVEREFGRVLEEGGEVGAAVAAYVEGKVVDLWGGLARPASGRPGRPTRPLWSFP